MTLLFDSLWQLGEACEQAGRIIGDLSEPDAEAKLSNFERAVQYYARARGVLDSNESIFSNVDRLRGHIAYRLAVCLEQVGQWNNALEEANRAVENYELAGDKESIGRAALLSAALCQRLRLDEKARQRYYYARSFFESLGDMNQVASTKVQIGILLVRQGATEAALEELRDARSIYTEKKEIEMVDQVDELIKAALMESQAPIEQWHWVFPEESDNSSNKEIK